METTIKLYLLVKVYDLVVDGVEVFTSEEECLKRHREWTKDHDHPDGVTPSELSKLEEEQVEYHYAQTQIIEASMKIAINFGST